MNAWVRTATGRHSLSTALEGDLSLTDLFAAEPICEFQRFPFNHPLFVLFSSGTTGKPKCIVHGAGGTLLQHLKEHQLHGDIKPAKVQKAIQELGIDPEKVNPLRA